MSLEVDDPNIVYEKNDFGWISFNRKDENVPDLNR